MAHHSADATVSAKDAIEATGLDDDATNTVSATRGVYVGTTGDLKVLMASGRTVTLPAVAGGVEHAFQIRKVFSTGTTATGVFYLY